MRCKNHGFTLIELLVVISIISLLASVVLSSLNSARASARDAQRVAAARQIQLALEQYYAANGSYPQGSWVSSWQAGWQTNYLATALEPYMPTLSVDPVNSGSESNGAYNGSAADDLQQVYSYFASGYGSQTGDQQWYMFYINLEGDHSIETQSGVTRCSGGDFTGSAVYNIVALGGDCVR